MPEWLQIYLWGCLGSAIVEIGRVLRAYERGKIPKRYKTIWFWVVRVVYGLLSGGVAVAYGISSPVLAIHIGVATPLIVTEMARQFPAGHEG